MKQLSKSLGVGILPTDTLYGVVGSALSESTVERIYRLRKRDPKKPMIVLIGSISDLKKFGLHPSAQIKKILNKYWPGKVSIVLPVTGFRYLHRGAGTVAFRLPEPQWLRSLLRKTGPLVAPSANIEGKPPATTIAEAKKYFGDGVDFYVDAGTLRSKPSTLAKIENGALVIIRKGAVNVK